MSRSAVHRPPILPGALLGTLLLALLPWGPVAGAENSFKLDPERILPPGTGLEPVERVEAAAPLPPWPRDADLLAFVPDGPELPFRFFVDGRSLSLHDRDSEVHFTLVIESQSGTRNVSFDGIRCSLRGSYKTFAYGSDGRFMKAPGAEWQAIPERGTDAYREDLRQRFCIPREHRARPLKDLKRALSGRISRTDGTGFQAQ